MSTKLLKPRVIAEPFSENQAQSVPGAQLMGTRMDAIQGDAAGAVEKGADFDGGGFLGDGTKLQPALNRIWKVGHVVKRAMYSTYGIEDMDATYQSRLNPAIKDNRATDAGTRETSLTRRGDDIPIDVAHTDQSHLGPINPGGNLQTTSDVGVQGAGVGTGEMEDNPVTEVEEAGPQRARIRQAKGLDKRAAVAKAWIATQTSPALSKLAQVLQERAYDAMDAGPEPPYEGPPIRFKMPGQVRPMHKESDAEAQPGRIEAATQAMFEPLEPIQSSNPLAEVKRDVLDTRKAVKLVRKILNDQPLI